MTALAADCPSGSAPHESGGLAQDPSAFVTDAGGHKALDILVRGARCGACLLKIETGMSKLPGVQSARHAGFGSGGNDRNFQQAILWLLNQSNGIRGLLEIAERSGLEAELLDRAAVVLSEHGLLQAVSQPQGSRHS